MPVETLVPPSAARWIWEPDTIDLLLFFLRQIVFILLRSRRPRRLLAFTYTSSSFSFSFSSWLGRSLGLVRGALEELAFISLIALPSLGEASANGWSVR